MIEATSCGGVVIYRGKILLLYKNYHGSLAVGDKLVIGNCGSYSIVMKPPFILPNFPIVSIEHGEISEIKRSETFGDVFNTYDFD